MNKAHMARQFPIRKNPIHIISSNYSDSDYSTSDDQPQAKNTLHKLKLSEDRPKSLREKVQNNIILFDSEKDSSPNNKQKSSFLSDDENLCEQNNHISTFTTPKKNPNNIERSFRRQEKPDMIRRKEELQPHIQQQQVDVEHDSQDQHDVVRKKKRKKIRSKTNTQNDTVDRSVVIENTQSRQPQPNFSKTQPPNKPPQPQQPQSLPSPQSPQIVQRTISQLPQQKPQSSQNQQQAQPQSQPLPNKSQQQRLQQQQLQQKQLFQQRTLQRTLQIQQNQQHQQQQQKQPKPQLPPNHLNHQQEKHQIYQIQADQETDTEKDQDQNQSTPDSSLSKISPIRKRYNSTSNKIPPSTLDESIKPKSKPPRSFPKPVYQDFTKTPKTDSNSQNSSEIETTQEEDQMVTRKRKKVPKKSVKLSISTPNYVTFYYNSPNEPLEPPPGDLIGVSSEFFIQPFSPQGQSQPSLNTITTPVSKGRMQGMPPPLPINNHKQQRGIPPIPLVDVKKMQQPSTSRPIPSPKLIDTNEIIIHQRQRMNIPLSKTGTEEDEYQRNSTEYESENSEIMLSKSGSHSGKLNKSFMSAAVFNDLNEQYNPSNEERQQAFESTLQMQTSTLAFHRVPTLSVFEQNATNKNNGNGMLTDPQVSFSRMCFDLSNHDETETETEPSILGLARDDDFNNNKMEGVVIDLNKEMQDNGNENENDDDVEKVGNLKLSELRMNKVTKETNPEFRTLENKFKEIVNKNQNVAKTIKPQSNLIEYNLTITNQPNEDDISIFEQEGFYCIEKITPEAFIEFKFGSQVTEPNPDHLHLFTWHNLALNQTDILNSLLQIVSKIEEDDSGLIQIKSIIQYVFIWIYLFAADFYGNSEPVSLLRQVLNVVLDKSKTFESHFSVITKDICFLKACLDSLSQKKSQPDSYVIPLMAPRKMLTITFRPAKLKELKVEPAVLVKHFTYVELQLLQKIDRSEIIKQATFKFESKEQKEKLMPNYTNYYVRFNNTAVFIALSILVEGSKNRAKKIEYWIRVMEEAKKFRNYFLLYEIDAALSCFPINRLEKSWKKIGKKFIALFNGLHSITNPTSKAIIAYKNEVNKMPTKTMPYIGPFLTELKYIYEGRKLMLPMKNGKKDGYNMKYHRAFCNSLEQIFQEWGTKIEFQIDNSLLDQCINLEGKELKTEDLMPYSNRFEPPNS